MTIKLTPEHVGTRVMLSDGKIRLVTHHGTSKGSEWWKAGELRFNADGKYFHHPNHPHCITLLLDAPNPLDVPVPEWCRWVIGWRVFDAAPPHLIPAIHGSADFPHDVFGWSPAPGQMPRREDFFV